MVRYSIRNFTPSVYHANVIKWKHFFALLVLCEGNSTKKRPVMRSFEVFFDLRLNKRLCKHLRRPLETPSRSLWRHRNVEWFTYYMAWPQTLQLTLLGAISPSEDATSVMVMYIIYWSFCLSQHHGWIFVISRRKQSNIIHLYMPLTHLLPDKMAVTSQTTFSNALSWIQFCIKLAQNFVPRGAIDNKSALVQVMTWHRSGDKPSSGTMLTQFADAYMRH